ncbi:unnamed protein product, partial [Closterium sp. Naga37s-1]
MSPFSCMHAASAAIWGLTLACYAAMVVLPRRLSGYIVFLVAFAFLIFWSAPLPINALPRLPSHALATSPAAFITLTPVVIDLLPPMLSPILHRLMLLPSHALSRHSPSLSHLSPMAPMAPMTPCAPCPRASPPYLPCPHASSPISPMRGPTSHATSLDASAWRRGDIDFTGTLMIVTLKLVGAAMDCQDGSMGQQDGRERQDGKEKQDGSPPRASRASPTALPRVPPLLPFLGFVFFPAALLVGPPFPFAAYHDYVEGRGPSSTLPPPHSLSIPPSIPLLHFSIPPLCPPSPLRWQHWSALYPHKHAPAPAGPAFPPRVLPACRALCKALLCLAVYHSLSLLLPPSALTQPAFFARPFLIRCGQVALTLLAYRWMFYFIWAVAESALILSAFGFSGFKPAKTGHEEGDQEGREGVGGQQQQQRLEADWSGASNAHIWVVEVTGSAAQLPSNWNIGVSNWLRTYVYDRMTPPSGKPTLTTLLVTQAVSALWHGLHPGYYLFFLSAAIAQDASKLLHRLHQSIPHHRRWQRRVAWIAQMLYTRVLVGYAPLGFI